MASVLLVDSGDCLRRGAAPRFPKDLIALVDGLKIGPSVGSCGTAAYRKEQVIVTDIETDPLWNDYRNLTGQYRPGRPVDSHFFFGTFVFWESSEYIGTNLKAQPQPTSASSTKLPICSVAIERQAFQEAIRASERFARGQADTLTRALDEIARESSFDQYRRIMFTSPDESIGRFQQQRISLECFYRIDGSRVCPRKRSTQIKI